MDSGSRSCYHKQQKLNSSIGGVDYEKNAMADRTVRSSYLRLDLSEQNES